MTDTFRKLEEGVERIIKDAIERVADRRYEAEGNPDYFISLAGEAREVASSGEANVQRYILLGEGNYLRIRRRIERAVDDLAREGLMYAVGMAQELDHKILVSGETAILRVPEGFGRELTSKEFVGQGKDYIASSYESLRTDLWTIVEFCALEKRD